MKRIGTRCLPLLTVMLILLPLSVLTSFAQTPHSPVESVEQLYRQGKLERAELEALRLLQTGSELIAQERAQLYKILAYTAIAREEPDLGRKHFLEALQLDPNLRLNRNLTSPKILAVFDAALLDFEENASLHRRTDARSVLAYKLRVEGAQRSLLLPGLGQLHKGHSLRGNLFLGSFGVSMVGLIYSQAMVLDAENRYQSSEEPLTAAENYEDYRGYWRLRNAFGYTAIAIWAASVVEAFMTPPDLPGDAVDIAFGQSRHGDTPLLGITIRF